MTAVPPPAEEKANWEASSSISTVEELMLAVRTDSRFEPYVIQSDRGAAEVCLPTGSLFLLWPEVWQDRGRMVPYIQRARPTHSPIVLLGDDTAFSSVSLLSICSGGDIAVQTLPLGKERLAIILRNYAELCRLRRSAIEGEILSERYRAELDELSAIGRALSSQRDLDKLLSLILERMRHVTGADAGSVYVVDDAEDTTGTIHFKVSQNDSVVIDLKERKLPISAQSIVGRCVLSREMINIADLYELDEPGTGNNPWGFRHNRELDAKIQYQARSMLAVPMVDAKDRVIGVIQLINKKLKPEAKLRSNDDFRRLVVPFDIRCQELAATIASQAGVSLENALLYDDIHQLFEGFVKASVTAIESRDPTTSGHSQRVAELTVALAEATAAADVGPYASFSPTKEELKTIEYAGLLHDFGKVGVREAVLVKAKKLYDHEQALLFARFDYIRKSHEAEYAEKKLRHVLDGKNGEGCVADLDAELSRKLEELDRLVAIIVAANEPTVLDVRGFEMLADVSRHTYRDREGNSRPYLTNEEVRTLQIPRGSLTEKERLQIESHVAHTYNFLKKIPWGRNLKALPEIAGAHHEKLDGSGYPRGLAAEDIPVAAKMMTIADIWDALTASDRPYKRAVPAEKALDIIATEVKQGKCDPDLFKLFVDAKIWQLSLRAP